MSGCMIMGKIPDEIGNLSNIYNLDFTDNDLTGSIPTTALRGLRSLQGMFLGYNKIQGSLPDNLCNLPELSHLHLRHNQISGPIPDCIGNVTSLREIYLASNRLSSSIPLGLWNLKDILELDLSSNSLTGNLPQGIGNLKVATYINLSMNGFTGAIPDSYGNMQNLINFSLASNKLQGPIPQSFGKMISLVSLDLSNNELSGEIPKVLEGLTLLTNFNVSFNKLRGEIPSGGPFKSFNYLSFVSNEGLCGAPELRVPRCSYGSSHGKRRRRRRRIFLILAVVIGSLIITALLVFAWIMRRHRRRKAAPFETADSYHSKEVERFSYQQLKQATDDFSDGNLLGSGSFGSVYRATFQNGILFAVKVFDLQQEYASKSFETECDMLSKLRHRNLTKVISACSNLDFKALLLEYMQNGSLEEWLYSDGHFLDILQRLNVMIDVASALEYLHHGYIKPVIHCDLKPSNILLDRDMVGHVTDFGITKLLGEEESIVHTQTLATLGYMAPGNLLLLFFYLETVIYLGF